MESEYTIVVHEDSDGSYWAEVAELPGCFGSALTLDELDIDIHEAIEVYLEAVAELGL